MDSRNGHQSPRSGKTRDVQTNRWRHALKRFVFLVTHTLALSQTEYVQQWAHFLLTLLPCGDFLQPAGSPCAIQSEAVFMGGPFQNACRAFRSS